VKKFHKDSLEEFALKEEVKEKKEKIESSDLELLEINERLFK